MNNIVARQPRFDVRHIHYISRTLLYRFLILNDIERLWRALLSYLLGEMGVA